MVELDVQLSKDKIPVIYHDFNVNVVIKNVRLFEVLLMPISKLKYFYLFRKIQPKSTKSIKWLLKN